MIIPIAIPMAPTNPLEQFVAASFKASPLPSGNGFVRVNPPIIKKRPPLNPNTLVIRPKIDLIYKIVPQIFFVFQFA